MWRKDLPPARQCRSNEEAVAGGVKEDVMKIAAFLADTGLNI
jgi:hypothetical protein